jgi:hypothetical protein
MESPHLFVGKNSAQSGTPIDRYFCLVCQTALVEAQENPLCKSWKGAIRWQQWVLA